MSREKIFEFNSGEKEPALTSASLDRQPTENKDKSQKKRTGKEKYEELECQCKRALADYQNLLKQTARERSEFIKYANEQLLHEVLPVYDNLKMSLEHADKEAKKSGWLEGIKCVAKQFKDVLESIGVEEIKTVGEKFDHHTMEAVEGKGEKVKRELKPGYKLNGKVIEPAKVILE